MNTSVTPSSSQEGISLSNEQRDGVIEQFVELVVDGMDTKDLVRYVSEQLTEYYEDCSNIELKEFVDNYDEDLFEELVDNSNHINQNPQKVYGGTKSVSYTHLTLPTKA